VLRELWQRDLGHLQEVSDVIGLAIATESANDELALAYFGLELQWT
jgi:hypothetical protein